VSTNPVTPAIPTFLRPFLTTKNVLSSPTEEDLDFFWGQAIVAVPASCGILGKVGSIRSSTSRKLTDVVAVPADPVENIWQMEHVSFVMKGGVIYKNDCGAPVR